MCSNRVVIVVILLIHSFNIRSLNSYASDTCLATAGSLFLRATTEDCLFFS